MLQSESWLPSLGSSLELAVPWSPLLPLPLLPASDFVPLDFEPVAGPASDLLLELVLVEPLEFDGPASESDSSPLAAAWDDPDSSCDLLLPQPASAAMSAA